MTGALRLVIFDVDGTLVDSQGDILAAMRAGISVSRGCRAPEAPGAAAAIAREFRDLARLLDVHGHGQGRRPA